MDVQDYLCYECGRAFYHDQMILESTVYCAHPLGIPHRGLCEECYPANYKRYTGSLSPFIDRPFQHALFYHGTAVLPVMFKAGIGGETIDEINEYRVKFIFEADELRELAQKERIDRGCDKTPYFPDLL